MRGKNFLLIFSLELIREHFVNIVLQCRKMNSGSRRSLWGTLYMYDEHLTVGIVCECLCVCVCVSVRGRCAHIVYM